MLLICKEGVIDMAFGYSDQVRKYAEEAKKKAEAESKEKIASALIPLPSYMEAVKTAADVASRGNEFVKDVYGGTITSPKDPLPSQYGFGGIAKEYAPTITPTVSPAVDNYVHPLLSRDSVYYKDMTGGVVGGIPDTYYKDPYGGVVAGVPSTRSGSSGSSRGGTGSSSPKAVTPQTFTPTYESQQFASSGQGEVSGGDYQAPQFIYDWGQAYKSELANLRDEELALAASLNDQFMRQIDSLMRQYEQYYTEMGQGIDPATEAALAKLREEMTNDQRMIMEYLNARGVAQSGIAAEEVGRLAGSFTDKKSQMLAQRITDLQNQFLSSLQNFMDQKIAAMGQYSQNAMGAQGRYTQGMESAMQNAMSMTFGAWQQEQAQKAAMEQSMLPYTQGPTPYQQQQLDLQKQGQQQQYNQQMQQYQQQYDSQMATNEAIAELAAYRTREEAISYIRNNAAGLAQAGADIPTLYKALDMYWPPQQTSILDGV